MQHVVPATCGTASGTTCFRLHLKHVVMSHAEILSQLFGAAYLATLLLVSIQNILALFKKVPSNKSSSSKPCHRQVENESYISWRLMNYECNKDLFLLAFFILLVHELHIDMRILILIFMPSYLSTAGNWLKHNQKLVKKLNVSIKAKIEIKLLFLVFYIWSINSRGVSASPVMKLPTRHRP